MRCSKGHGTYLKGNMALMRGNMVQCHVINVRLDKGGHTLDFVTSRLCHVFFSFYHETMSQCDSQWTNIEMTLDQYHTCLTKKSTNASIEKTASVCLVYDVVVCTCECVQTHSQYTTPNMGMPSE